MRKLVTIIFALFMAIFTGSASAGQPSTPGTKKLALRCHPTEGDVGDDGDV